MKPKSDPEYIKIKEWLDKYYRGSFKINTRKRLVIPQGKNYIDITNNSIHQFLPDGWKFEPISGDFYCAECKKLKTLEGSPEYVGGSFICEFCHSLKTLEGAPEKVDGDFYCSACKGLTSLEGAPEMIGGSFNCCQCKSLNSLEGISHEIGGDLSCNGCPIKNFSILKR